MRGHGQTAAAISGFRFDSGAALVTVGGVPVQRPVLPLPCLSTMTSPALTGPRKAESSK